MSGLISTAYAATNAAAGSPADSMMSSFLLLFGFIAIFYFVLWRPQSKRAKEHRALIDNINKGDEVVTSGGIVGKVAKISDDFLVITIAEGVEITVQKQAIATALPKGTIKSITQ